MTRIGRRGFLALAGAGGVAAAGGAFFVLRGGARAPEARPDDLAAVEARQAAHRAALCSSANVAGVGLRGEYFAAERCAGAPLLVRLDGGIDFDATLDWPAREQAGRPRSVRWSGWVKPAIAGAYRFHAGAGDAARISVSQQPLAGAGAPADARIELAAGRFYPIVIELDRVASIESRIRLEWTAPHGARFAVPRALLYLPMEGLQPSRSA